MNDFDLFGSGGDRRAFWQVVAQFDGPAFLRRARSVEEAWETILRQCREQRDIWLEIPRLRLATLMSLAGDQANLAQFLGDRDDADLLLELNREWAPHLRCPVTPTRSAQRLRRALCELVESFERFNKRWERFLEKVTLADVNRLRVDYNRYYLVEKECALGSPVLARRGFESLPPVTARDLMSEFPPLPLFQVSVRQFRRPL